MNNYEIDGDIKLSRNGAATIRTDEGHHLFIVYENDELTVHIESDEHNGCSDKSLATVTKDGWKVSHG